MKHELFLEKLVNFSLTLKYSKKRGKSEIGEVRDWIYGGLTTPLLSGLNFDCMGRIQASVAKLGEIAGTGPPGTILPKWGLFG